MKPEYLLRQQDIIPVEVLGTPITVIGAGAIGGFSALALAKMGFGDIQVWDDDVVSTENMNNQFFPIDSMGTPKTTALAEMLLQMTGTAIDCKQMKWGGQMLRPGILVTAVDSMHTRKLLWQHAKKNPGIRLVIDPRMGAEEIQLWAARPDLPKDDSYADTLYTDEQAEPERCTAKSTIYTVMLVSGMVARIVKGYLVEKVYPRTTTWSVRHNQMLMWNSEGKKCT